MSAELDKGLVQVYTGNGKGKTTAAIGLAVRAAGRDLNIYIGQFMKSPGYGEHNSLKELSERITVEQLGKEGFHVEDSPDEEDIKRAREGLEKIKKAMRSGDYDIVIADEICVAHYFDLLNLEDLKELIGNKPGKVELVFTGRKAPEEIIEMADLVTEMKDIKHPFEEGIEAREGIEH